MVNVLITGASGFLGSYLSLFMSHFSNYSVIGIGNTFSKQSSKNFKYCQMDLTIPKNFKMLEDINPDVVIHCVALTNVDLCDKEPDKAEKINVNTSEYVS